jgi:hypothetical protein
MPEAKMVTPGSQGHRSGEPGRKRQKPHGQGVLGQQAAGPQSRSTVASYMLLEMCIVH